MADSPAFIFYLLLYVAFTSSAIAIFAAGISNVQMTGDTIINYTAPEEESFLSGIPVLGGAFDSASILQSFLMALIGVLFWTLPEAVFPLWANVIFIKIPLIALIGAILDVVLP